MKPYLWTFLAFLILVPAFGSGSLYSQEDQYLLYPYVASSHLHKGFDAQRIARFESLNKRLMQAINERTPYRKTKDLFLTRRQKRKYAKYTFKNNPDMSDADRQSFKKSMQEAESSNMKKWNFMLNKVKEDNAAFDLVDYGLSFEPELEHYYFLIQFKLKSEHSSSGIHPRTLEFLAVSVDGKIRILVLDERPFLFSF